MPLTGTGRLHPKGHFRILSSDALLHSGFLLHTVWHRKHECSSEVTRSKWFASWWNNAEWNRAHYQYVMICTLVSKRKSPESELCMSSEPIRIEGTKVTPRRAHSNTIIWHIAAWSVFLHTIRNSKNEHSEMKQCKWFASWRDCIFGRYCIGKLGSLSVHHVIATRRQPANSIILHTAL